MVTTTEISNTLTERVKNIPASVASGTNLLNMVEDARVYVQNFLGVSIDSSNVPEKYQNPIRNQAICYALMATHSDQSDYNVSAGEVTVSKADGLSPDRTQLNYYKDLVEQEMHRLQLESPPWGQTFYR